MQNILDMLNTEKCVEENAAHDMEMIDRECVDFEETLSEINVNNNRSEEDSENHNNILAMIFDDTYIKAESSPFRTFPDDKQEFLRKTNYVDLGKAIQQYRNGEIEERMLRILDIVVQHKYISVRQIWQMYLLKFGKYIKRDNLNRLLNRMAEKGLVVGFIVRSSIGETMYHTYCADYNGIRLHTALTSESINWKRTDTLQKPYIIKRSLAKNQFLIAYLKYYDVDYKLQPKLMFTKDGGREMAVTPAIQLTFKLKEQLDSIVFLVETIRTYQGWEEDYSEKIIRYGQYMKSVEDTQILKKYYIIICAESPEQVKEAAQVFYRLRHVKKIQELRDIKLFYTYDLELLDNHIEKCLLDNLRSLEYSYEKKAWEECHLNFEFEKKDWHNIEFEIEEFQQTKVSDVLEEFELEEIKTEELGNNKQKLAKIIYNIVKKQGWDFPQSITRLAIPLKTMGIDYKKMGYRRLKELFEDLSKFYIISYESPTEMVINYTDELSSSFGDSEEQVENNTIVKEENNEDQNWGTDLDIIEKERNIIANYFSQEIASSHGQKKAFVNDIFCFRNWDMSVALIIKMTHNYDLSKDGWLNILAFSYYLARKEKRIIQNKLKNYMCFDTGLLTYDSEKIYLLAKRNYREKPEWILEGLSTVHSRVLGEILKKEFDL